MNTWEQLAEDFQVEADGPRMPHGLGAEVHLVLKNGRQVDLDKPTWDALVKVAQAGTNGNLPANVIANLKLFLKKIGG